MALVLPARLRRAALIIAVLVVGAGLLPSRAEAAVPRRHAVHTKLCERAPSRCLALTQHERLSPVPRVRPDSDEAVVDLDDWDFGTDPTSNASPADHTTVTDPDRTPPWARARRTINPLAARLIVWRKLAAPRPPPSL